MKKEFDSAHFDVPAFTQAHTTLDGEAALRSFPRLLEETAGAGAGQPVRWTAVGESRTAPDGSAQPWLHLSGATVMPLTCQRCLEIADIAVDFHQSFRFVADEATAEAQDDDAEEDLLVLSHDFSLDELIEDELLMALPAVPTHDVCPAPVTLEVKDADFDVALEAKPNPFAVLADLQKGKAG